MKQLTPKTASRAWRIFAEDLVRVVKFSRWQLQSLKIGLRRDFMTTSGGQGGITINSAHVVTAVLVKERTGWFAVSRVRGQRALYFPHRQPVKEFGYNSRSGLEKSGLKQPDFPTFHARQGMGNGQTKTGHSVAEKPNILIC
jgi:hypothetical protein